MKIERLNHIFTGFVTNILGTLSMFGVTIYLTRTVDQVIYGEFRLAFSFISLMVVLLLLGRDNGVVYFTQKVSTENEKQRIISQESFYTLQVLIIGSLLLFLFRDIIVIKVFNNNISIINYSLSILMLPLWGWFNMGIAALRAKKFINYSFTLTNLIQRLIRVPFFVVFVYLSESFFSLTISMIISQVLLLFLMIKKVPWITYFKNINYSDFFLRFKYSIQLGLTSIIFVVLSKIDVIMIGKLTSVENVAVYDICVMLSMVVIFPYTALVKASEPVVLSILSDNQKMTKYTNNLNLSVGIASIVVLAYIMNSELILSIFGNEYTSGNLPLIILAVGYLIISFLASPIEFLSMSGNVNYSLSILVTSLILNVILNYILIPIYGLNGAALATTISLISTKIIALFVVKKKLNVGLIKVESVKHLMPLTISLSIYYCFVKYLDLLFIWKIVVSSLLILLTIILFLLSNSILRKKVYSLLGKFSQ